MKIITLLICAVLVLVACDNAPDKSARRVEYCRQATKFIDLADEGTITPRDWGNMMLAGSRLLYVTQECGTRVSETREELCVTLADSIRVFAASPTVPAGDNRDTAIRQSSKVYRSNGCHPSLTID